MNSPQTRRTFLRQAALAGAALPFAGVPASLAAPFRSASHDGLQVQVFSKHLQFLDYRDMADAAANIGFDGVDLAVRPRGHVLPERVADDLPRAVEALRQVGLKHPMMTTAVDDADDPIDQQVLKTAVEQGIKLYRMNWLRYPPDKSIPEAIQGFRPTLRKLGQLNRDVGITGCYQNHSGTMAGASLWELWDMIQDADPQFLGIQYDIRHAVVEGGLSWTTGLRLIRPRIRSLAIKDFVWTKRNGKYAIKNVPLGEGMVDFKRYFALLKEFDVNVPISMHFEYPLGGAERGSPTITVDKKLIFEAMKSDLAWLRRTWAKA